MEEACCLCRRSVMEGSAIVKHKRFHGKTCESSKKQINDVLIVKRKRFHGKTCESSTKLINDVLKEHELSVFSFKETDNSNAFLCHQCHGQASKCVKLEEEIKTIKGNFLSLASKLTKLPARVTVGQRKRSVTVRDSCEMSSSTVVQSESLRESGTTSLKLCENSL